MKVNGKYLNNKLFTPVKICLMAIIVLASALLWQQALVYRKDRALAELLSENAALKKNLFSIDGQLMELKETASDVRIFQNELVKVIKDMQAKHPVTLASAPRAASVCAHDEVGDFDSSAFLNKADERIFRLEASQQNLRFESANLLGRAVTIRDILSKTPSMIPVSNGYISSDFGIRRDPFTNRQKRHLGIDIAAPLNTPVFAAADGLVREAGLQTGFGKKVVLLHEDGYTSEYAHLGQILVKKGEQVKRGKEIARMGNTGRSSGPHLHFEIKHKGVNQDPKQFMFSSPPDVF